MTQEFPITNSTLKWLEGVLAERFGRKWHLTRSAAGLHLALEGGEGSIVFDTIEPGFTHARSDQPFTQWHAEREGWQSVLGGPLPAPGVASLPTPLIEKRGSDTYVHYDILGLTFWMLARIEEIGRTDLDNHDRFPATSSHAYKHGYLDRPVVDEWLHVLRQVIEWQWVGADLKRHQFKICVSHDVDRPSRYGFASPRNLLLRMGADLARGDLRSALYGPLICLITKTKLHEADPFNTFDWLMDQSERCGLKSAFYFICGRTSPSMDGEYDIEHPAMRDLLRRIHARGHEIGLHPSYNTFKNPSSLKSEADRLWRVCEEEHIQQTAWGGRMHYLRWKQPDTLRACNEAGMAYDSSLTYADHAGFRCGSCFDFPGFDAVGGEKLAVRVRPLIVMEASVFGENYMGLSSENARQVLKRLKERCRAVKGRFTLLWHNSELDISTRRRNDYQEVIGCG